MGGIKTGVSLTISLEILQTTTFNVFLFVLANSIKLYSTTTGV